jgi:hypothetical protein
VFHTPTKLGWRQEAKAKADELVTLACPDEALHRFPGMHGVLAEIHLRNRGWYLFTMQGRAGKPVSIFAELRTTLDEARRA